MKIRLLSTLILAIGPSALAQEVSGHMEGRVLASDSTAIPSVEVTAISSALLGTRTTISGTDGRFYIRGLPVGVYRVQLRRIGFRPAGIDSVRVWLASVTALKTVVLERQPAVELAPVTVVAGGAIDPSRTASSVVLSRASLSQLPLGRNFREIAMLLPEATPSFLGDGINIAGATGKENHFYVDGIDITHPVDGDRSIDLPYNFIQQIQVHSGGSTAEESMTLGGTVNVVTPSGGNEFAGSAFGFFSSSGLQSRGRTAGGATQSGFSFYDAGATLSGPIMRDRAWFFGAYNPRFERRDFRYEFGRLEEMVTVHQFAGKVTAALGANTTGMLTVLGDPQRSTPVGIGGFVPAGVTPLEAAVVTRNDRGGGIAVSARVQSQLRSALILEATLSHMSLRESGTPTSGTAPVIVDPQAGTVSGGHGFSFDRDILRQAASMDLSNQLGNHYMKAGARYERLGNEQSVWLETITLPGTDYLYLITTADAPGHLENRIPSLFLQDVWRATERLSITAGARLSRQEIVNRSGSTGGFRVNDGVQPRVGAVYQFGEIGTQRVFASYARVVEQMDLHAAIQFQRGKTLIALYPQDPRVSTNNETKLFELIRTGNGYPILGRLRPTSTDQWSLGYARRIREDLTGSVFVERRVLGEHVTLGGNPGRGPMSAFPRPNRTYNALHAALRRVEASGTWWHVAYTLSRTHGNLPGIYDPDYRLPSSVDGPLFDKAATWLNSTGLLPNDRTHVLKAYGSRALRYGIMIGASALAASGTPLSEYSLDHDQYLIFPKPRGTAGRTPWIWDASVRVAYDMPARFGTNSFRLIADVQHMGNPRRAVDFAQLRYTCEANDNTCESASYGRVTQYQPPMTARLGVEVTF